MWCSTVWGVRVENSLLLALQVFSTIHGPSTFVTFPQLTGTLTGFHCQVKTVTEAVACKGQSLACPQPIKLPLSNTARQRIQRPWQARAALWKFKFRGYLLGLSQERWQHRGSPALHVVLCSGDSEAGLSRARRRVTVHCDRSAGTTAPGARTTDIRVSGSRPPYFDVRARGPGPSSEAARLVLSLASHQWCGSATRFRDCSTKKNIKKLALSSLSPGHVAALQNTDFVFCRLHEMYVPRSWFEIFEYGFLLSAYATPFFLAL